MSRVPSGFKDISTTYQRAYVTYDGNVQVRKIGDRLWEVLSRGGVALYETSKQVALDLALRLALERAGQKGRH